MWRAEENKALEDQGSIYYKNISNKMINREEKNYPLVILICSINPNAEVSKHESLLNWYCHIFQVQTIRRYRTKEVGLIN